MTNELIEELKNAVIQGNPARAIEAAKRVIEEKIDPVEAFEEGLKAGISVVGEGFSTGELFLPDLVLSAETLKAASAILEDEIARIGRKHNEQGKIILGTVKGDLHDIGKTIVVTLLSSHGFDVVDLGVDVSTQKFIEAVKREKPDVIGMSSLLTVTAKEMANVITALEAEGLRNKIKVIIGGGAVTDAFAEEIGADAYGQNAELGVRKIKYILGSEWSSERRD
jgi:corrinoid protein of di/trimethylamine methyltransferase